MMEAKTKFMVASVVIALLIVPMISAYCVTTENALLFKNVGMFFIACGCSFLPYFLPKERLIDRAFIGGAALVAAVIQIWVIYGVNLSLKSNQTEFAVLLPLYVFSSLVPLLLSTLWAAIRPRWLYPTQGTNVKYALFGGMTTVINYLIAILAFYLINVANT